MTSSANISIFCEKVKTVGIEILYYYHIGLPSAKLGKFNTLWTCLAFKFFLWDKPNCFWLIWFFPVYCPTKHSLNSSIYALKSTHYNVYFLLLLFFFYFGAKLNNPLMVHFTSLWFKNLIWHIVTILSDFYAFLFNVAFWILTTLPESQM